MLGKVWSGRIMSEQINKYFLVSVGKLLSLAERRFDQQLPFKAQRHAE
jgi:hypothetical protein